MNTFKDRLLNILLYPQRYFERLTDGKIILWAGIILIGAVDLLLPDIAAVFKHYIAEKPSNDANFNILMLALIIVVVGIVDVMFISVPLFDFFRFIKKKEGLVFAHEQKLANGHGKIDSQETKPENLLSIASSIKIMKVYIMSHFIIVPVSVILHFAFLRDIAVDSPAWMQNVALIIFMLIFIWSAAIMARGINTLFRFSPLFKRLTFIIVFTWNFIFGMVFDMQIMNWLLRLLR